MVKAKRKRSIGKGYETEELIRGYFLKAGFYVMRGIALKYEGDDLTDIDIWIYERSATLARRRTIIDVKDKRSPQAAERLFFVSGLAKMIGVEGAGVATTDNRYHMRELAQKNKVIWINGEDIQRLKQGNFLAGLNRISDEDFFKLIDEADRDRGGREIRTLIDDVKSTVGDRFGISSANRALDGLHSLAENTVKMHPNSSAATLFGRLTYLSASIAAASFDFASADTALRPIAERQTFIANAIRYGIDTKSMNDRLEWTEAAIREFVPEGANIAKSVRKRLSDSMNSIPAESLAEVIVTMSKSDRLFEAAKSLENAAYSISVPSFESLDTNSKSLLGALLDFTGVDRQKFASSWKSTVDAIPADQLNVQGGENKDVNEPKLI